MIHDDDDMTPMSDAVRMVGDGWTLLILWAALHGITRFDTFQRRLGMARNILSNRLARLVDEGIMEKRPVQPGARRLEYRLTTRGLALKPVIEGFEDWGRSSGARTLQAAG